MPPVKTLNDLRVSSWTHTYEPLLLGGKTAVAWNVIPAELPGAAGTPIAIIDGVPVGSIVPTLPLTVIRMICVAPGVVAIRGVFGATGVGPVTPNVTVAVAASG